MATTEIECLADSWTKVETALKKGRISTLDGHASQMLFATVGTAGVAPTTIDQCRRFRGSIVKDDLDSVDVYVWPVGSDCKIRSIKEG